MEDPSTIPKEISYVFHSSDNNARSSQSMIPPQTSSQKAGSPNLDKEHIQEKERKAEGATSKGNVEKKEGANILISESDDE